MFITGCMSADYTGSDGRHLKLTKIGLETSIGDLEIQTPEGSLKLKTLTDKDTATPLLNKALDKIPNATTIPIP